MTDVEKGTAKQTGSFEVGREEKGSREGCCAKFLEIMCWILIILPKASTRGVGMEE